jgi:integrase
MVVISPEQLERLVGVVKPPNDLITLTLAYTGIRWRELAALRVENLELDKGTMRISESLAEVSGELIFDTTKTHRARTVALPEFLADQINTSVLGTALDSLTFTTKSGRPRRLSNWRSQVWRPALAASETVSTLRPHDLRHFCASVLIRSGASPVAVARQLGHSSPRVTLDVYSHLFPSELAGVSQQLDTVRREASTTHARHAAISEPDPIAVETPESPVINRRF